MRKFLFMALSALSLWGAGQLSPGVYRELTEIQKLIEGKKSDEAAKRIDELLAETQGDYNLAFIYQAQGYLYLESDQPAKAKASFEKVLTLKALEGSAYLNILQNLGALCIQDGEYEKGIDYLLRWLKEAPKPSAGVHITLATAYVKLEKTATALEHAKTAVALATEPKEPWYRLLSALYYQNGQLDNAVTTLEKTVEFFGVKKDYLTQLFGILMQQEKQAKALAVWALAYRSGLLESKEEYEQLAMLHGSHGVPLDAAKILVEGMQKGILPKDLEHLRLTYEYFLGAKEYESAKTYLAQAAELSEKGELYLQYGQLLFEAEAYAEAAQAFENALKKGKIKHVADTWMLLGISYYEAGNDKESKRAFTQAEGFEKSRASAKSWINFLQSRE